MACVWCSTVNEKAIEVDDMRDRNMVEQEPVGQIPPEEIKESPKELERPPPSPPREADVEAPLPPVQEPPMLAAVKEPENEGADESKPQSCLAKIVSGILQQNESKVTLPHWCYRPLPQVCCAGSCSALFICMGIFMLSTAGGMWEVKPISYKHGDTYKEFTIDTAFDKEVWFYYELPGVFANRKQIVENKDPDIMYTMMSRVACFSAETQADLWRRGCSRATAGGPLTCPEDPDFAALINAVPSKEDFAPCGLVGLAMFIDEYDLQKWDSGTNTWTSIAIDQSQIALKNERGPDAKVWKKLTYDATGNILIGSDTKKRSWVRPGNFLEHFKVWYRVPASPHVRNLWGRIPGLQVGKYRVNFNKNSAIWTKQWGLQEKRVVLAGQNTFGNKGAVTFLGSVCLVCGIVEGLMLLVFVALFVMKK